MEGSTAASKKRRVPPMEERYSIRSLSAPMRLSATGELCSRLFITSGTTLTIGRSKKGCDVIFEDARVSRKHCQLRLLPHSNSLILLDGYMTFSNGMEARLGSQFNENVKIADSSMPISMLGTSAGAFDDRCVGSQLKRPSKKFRDRQVARNITVESVNTKASTPCEAKHTRTQGLLSESIRGHKGGDKRCFCDKEGNVLSSSVFCRNSASGPWKPSLNGIFVNGCAFNERMMILMPGDEVSLVGPTEGGKGLDFDCPAAIGFVVEMQPTAKKAQPAPSSSSSQALTQHTIGDNFSAPDMSTLELACISHDVAGMNQYKCGQHAQLDTLSSCPNHAIDTKHDYLTTGVSIDVKPPGGVQCTESDSTTAGSSTECPMKSGFEGGAVQGRNISPLNMDVKYNLQPGKKIAMCSVDLDSKFISTFNLVKASKRLRSDLLNSYIAESSNATVGQRDLLLISADKGIHSTAGDNLTMEYTMPTANAATDVCCNLPRSQECDHVFKRIYPQEIFKHDSFTVEYTMPMVNAVADVCGNLSRIQGGDNVFEEIFKHDNFTMEYTMPIVTAVGNLTRSQGGDNVFEKIHPQKIFKHENFTMQSTKSSVNAATDVCGNLTRSQGGDHVFEKESPVKKFSAGDQMSSVANASQRTRTLLVSQSVHTVSATNCFDEVLQSQNAFYEKGIASCLDTLPTNDDSFQDIISGSSSKGVFNCSQPLAVEEWKGKVAEEAAMKRSPCEPACLNGMCRLSVKTETWDQTAAASLTVIQVDEEELSGGQAKDNIKVCAEEECLAGVLNEGQVVKDEMCSVKGEEPLDLQENDQARVHIAEQEAVCSKTLFNLALQGAVTSMCVITDEDEDSANVDGDSSKEINGLGSSKTDNEGTSREKVHNNVLRIFDLEDTIDVHDKNASAVRDLVPQQVTCNIHRPQSLDPGICKSEVPAAELCHCLKESITASVDLKKWQLCKDEALVCTLKSNMKLGFECSVVDVVLNKDQVCTTQEHDDLPAKLTSIACLEQVRDDFGEDNAGALKDTKLTTVSILEQTCIDATKGDAATQGVVEQSESFQSRQDLDCTHSLVANIEVGQKIKRVASDAQTESINTAGYYLNQLKDNTTGAHQRDNTVQIWDLLDLTNDVQALFIATFTYDLEWFLSSAGLSPNTPVTVACHNVKRCWSRASKDRCEKPFLDWPNVSLVYPPFPRSNAFGKGQGIGCHHPKIFIVRRIGSLRVIVSSANLTYKQWFHVTNNVWWQDFPSRPTPNFRSLFRGEEKTNTTATPDFASQLAIFLAALLVDAPSEAHWVTDLAGFDFSDAVGSLVASVPGIHQPLYQNAPQFSMSLNEESYSHSLHGDAFVSNHLGIVPTTVAGIRYRFCASADRNGTRIRSLASVLNDITAHEASTMPVLLKRMKFLKADPNAVSVIVTSRVKGCSQDLFVQEDLHDAGINTMESDTLQTADFIKLGFLPRDVASWLAVLCDRGFFSFAACIWPSEALPVASGQCDGAVRLALYVFQGPKFSTLSPTTMTSEESGAFSGLVKSLHNTWGLWRLQKVLCKYNWIESHESDFYVASSSIGTSLDAKFLGAFAAAAGRRADSTTLSQESDPQWGCWTAAQEAANPSIGIVFPSIDRVRQDNFLHYGLLCFAESAWLRLKSARLLHDAVPYPPEREGFPMHIKVARRRFQEFPWSRPYGWMYCGSHNFSPAAWGRPLWRAKDWEAATDAGSILGSSLHICNYELGIVLMEPPPDEDSFGVENESDRVGLDRFVLPFKVPPPIYRDCDRPATGRAMMEAYLEMRALQLKAAEEEDLAVMRSEDPVEELCHVQQEVDAACNAEGEEARAEEVYVEALWSQIEEEKKTDDDATDESK